MPITIYPSPERTGQNIDPCANSTADLLAATSKAWEGLPVYCKEQHCWKSPAPENRSVLQSTFSDTQFSNSSSLVAYPNGLVHGIIRAFQQDLHLVLRPDDIWLAILTQFGMFVNGNEDQARHLFGASKGKKELEIRLGNRPLASVDVGEMGWRMCDLIAENVVDAELLEWVKPDFSTTTHEDFTVAAVLMMGTLKSEFEFSGGTGCGFPSVTLLGEKSDWKKILERVGRLTSYGFKTYKWTRLLMPVLNHMVLSFDYSDLEDVRNFWLRACHVEGSNGSGDVESLSGWLTAFCHWSSDGKRIPSVKPGTDYARGKKYNDRKPLTLGKVLYPIISNNAIPAGILTVPVTFVDEGAVNIEYHTTMVAGIVGMTVKSFLNDDGGKLFTPRSGWWILEDKLMGVLSPDEESDSSPDSCTSSEVEWLIDFVSLN